MDKINKLVIASHNKGKVKEIEGLLAPFKCDIYLAGDLGVLEPEETENTFEGNARLKAVHCFEKTKLPSLADDSGLVVPALRGQPGIYSARWAGPTKDFSLAFSRLEKELEGHADYSAYFVCVMALAFSKEDVLLFKGEAHGMLTFPKRGTRGFGYDPIFIPQGYNLTYGEMDPSFKESINHRTKAFKKLTERCFLKHG